MAITPAPDIEQPDLLSLKHSYDSTEEVDAFLEQMLSSEIDAMLQKSLTSKRPPEQHLSSSSPPPT